MYIFKFTRQLRKILLKHDNRDSGRIIIYYDNKHRWPNRIESTYVSIRLLIMYKKWRRNFRWSVFGFDNVWILVNLFSSRSVLDAMGVSQEISNDSLDDSGDGDLSPGSDEDSDHYSHVLWALSSLFVAIVLTKIPYKNMNLPYLLSFFVSVNRLCINLDLISLNKLVVSVLLCNHLCVF